ncbi:MAG TPA: hypothetical protein VFK10_11645 [Burkholderiaceae bacterium]|nr:hypothetical protein [Burkholderiaceae bacterium]
MKPRWQVLQGRPLVRGGAEQVGERDDRDFGQRIGEQAVHRADRPVVARLALRRRQQLAKACGDMAEHAQAHHLGGQQQRAGDDVAREGTHVAQRRLAFLAGQRRKHQQRKPRHQHEQQAAPADVRLAAQQPELRAQSQQRAAREQAELGCRGGIVRSRRCACSRGWIVHS